MQINKATLLGMLLSGSVTWPALLSMAFVSCVSTEPTLVHIPDSPEGPKAHTYSAVADGFSNSTAFSSRDTDPVYTFFYKDCELQQRRPYVSKIEYACQNIPWK